MKADFTENDVANIEVVWAAAGLVDFCSQLVAEAYAAGGLTVMTGTKPEKVTPGMLAASEVFEDVRDFLRFSKAMQSWRQSIIVDSLVSGR